MAPAPRASRSRAARDGGGEFLRAVVVEQRRAAGRCGRGAIRRAPARRSKSVAIAGTASRRRSRALDGLAWRVAASKPVEVRRVLDGLAGVVAAPVPRDLLGAGDDADGGGAREQRQRAADVRVRNRVAIAIEAHVRRLAGDDRCASRRSRRDARAAARAAAAPAAKTCGDGLIALLGMRALMRDVVAPAPKLRVQIVDIGKRPRGKERIAQVVDLALDLALLIGPARRARPRREMIVPGELEQARMKPNRGALRVRGRHCAGCRRPGSARRPPTA